MKKQFKPLRIMRPTSGINILQARKKFHIYMKPSSQATSGMTFYLSKEGLYELAAKKGIFKKGALKKLAKKISAGVKKIAKSPVFKKIVIGAALVAAGAVGGAAGVKIMQKMKGAKAMKELKEKEGAKGGGEIISKTTEEVYSKTPEPETKIDALPPEEQAARISELSNIKNTKTIPETIATARAMGLTEEEANQFVKTGAVNIGDYTYHAEEPEAVSPETVVEEPVPPEGEQQVIRVEGEDHPIARLLNPAEFQFSSAAKDKKEEEQKKAVVKKKEDLKKILSELKTGIDNTKKRIRELRTQGQGENNSDKIRIASDLELRLKTIQDKYENMKKDLRTMGSMQYGGTENNFSIAPLIILGIAGAMALLGSKVSDATKMKGQLNFLDKTADRVKKGELSPAQYDSTILRVQGQAAPAKAGGFILPVLIGVPIAIIGGLIIWNFVRRKKV